MLLPERPGLQERLVPAVLVPALREADRDAFERSGGVARESGDGQVRVSQPVTVTIITDRDGVMPLTELAAKLLGYAR